LPAAEEALSETGEFSEQKDYKNEKEMLSGMAELDGKIVYRCYKKRKVLWTIT